MGRKPNVARSNFDEIEMEFEDCGTQTLEITKTHFDMTKSFKERKLCGADGEATSPHDQDNDFLSKDRRQKDRFSTSNKIILHGRNGKMTGKGHLLNLSETGFFASIECDQLVPGEKVMLELMDSPDLPSGTYECTVVSVSNNLKYCFGQKRVGLKVTRASNRCYRLLKNYADSITEDRRKKLSGY